MNATELAAGASIRTGPAPRILLAKIGLDGHDRGVKVVARGLRDAGCHVIYSGLWQSIEAVVEAAADEDADWLGISLLSGAHMTLIPDLLAALKVAGLDHVRVLVGGILPDADRASLIAQGVTACFGPGASIAEIVAVIRSHAPARDL
jgi:methylmalonyl-CoA mutase cobalamin-binding domain/chain